MLMKMVASIRVRGMLSQAIKHLVLIGAAFAFILPIYWVVSTSLKTPVNVTAWPPQWIPYPVTLANYIRAFHLEPILRFYLNTAIIAVLLVVSNVTLCSIAGFTLARKSFRGRGAIFAIVVGSMMIPLNIRIIPMYIIMVRLGLIDTYAGIVLPIAATGFGVFMMRQFFITLPVEVEDAARVDGCSEWGIIFRIVVPESRPAMTSLAMFALVWSVEDFLWPLIVTSTTAMRPLPVGITMFVGLVVYEWGPVMAVTALTILPITLVYLLVQRRFVQGVTAGAVKG